MLRFHSGKFLRAHNFMSQLEVAAREWADNKVHSIDPTTVAEFLDKLDELVSDLNSMGLPLSSKTACKLRAGLAKNKTLASLDLAGDLARRIHDELELRYFLALSPSERDLYEQKLSLFGDKVEFILSPASEDISEAGKCLALGRYTATVFHLMRAMEIAVKSLGVKLNVTVIDKDNIDLEWGKILANLSTPIQAMPKGEEKEAWSAAQSFLVYVKIAWRNPTMHPKQTYTEEEAKSIFSAVRAFICDICKLL